MAMLAALLGFVGAVVWGAVFAFPEPDASPEKAAQIQLHARASGWVMIGSLSLFLGTLGRLLWTWSRTRGDCASQAPETDGKDQPGS
jgi:hypothetical protein